MTDIERLISRYLDRELSADEEGIFHRILSESPEARAQLKEMEAIRSAARRMPSLTMPAPHVESLLFQQLFAEETELAEVTSDRAAAPLLSRVTDVVRRRTGVLVASLALFITLGGGGIWLAGRSSGTTQLADASHPSSLPTDKIVRPEVSSILPLPSTPQAQSSIEGENTASLQRAEVVAAKSGGERLGASRGFTQAQNENQTPVGKGSSQGVNANVKEEGQEAFASQSATAPRHATSENKGEASWSAMTLLARSEAEREEGKGIATVENTVENKGRKSTDTDALEANKPQISYADLEAPSGRQHTEAISASYRHGLAYVANGGNQFTAQDFSLRVEGRFDKRHRLSLAVGQAPLLVERTTHTLPTGLAIKGGPSILSDQVEHSSSLADEVWAGIGYGYAVIATDHIRLEPGLDVAVGERSLRLSAELPIRYRVTERFSVDLIGSISRVQPHDQISHDVDREYAPTSFLHVDEEQHPVFTSIGASIGLSFDIGR